MCVMGKTEQICAEDGKMNGVCGIFGDGDGVGRLVYTRLGAFREIPLHGQFGSV